MLRLITVVVMLGILLLSSVVERNLALAQDARREYFIILVPHLNGESELGKSVANLLRLQVLGLLRARKPSTRGVVLSGEYQLPSSSHDEAVRHGMTPDAAAHLVLWGDAYSLSDGVAVQASLSVTPRLMRRKNRPEVWSVVLRGSEGVSRKLALGLPRQLYRFPSVLISNEAAHEYMEIEGRPIFATADFEKQIGAIGKAYRAFEYTPAGVRLVSNNTNGWVRLDFVSEEQNIIVEFSGAIIQLCRGDLMGAQFWLEEVAKRRDVPTDILTDTHLLLGLIKELQNTSGLKQFKRAVALSPLDRVSASYLLMGRVAEAQRTTGKRRDAMLDALSAELGIYDRLFASDSEWFALVREFSSGQIE